MLKDLDLDDVGVTAAIIRPHFFLLEAHAIKRQSGKPVAHLRKLLRIWKRAAQPLDHTGLSADIKGRADVSERRDLSHAYALADAKARFDRLRIIGRELRLRHLPSLRSTSSILPASSAVVMIPRWISDCVSATIQRS